MSDTDMRSPIATINWCGLDVKQLYPEWSDEKCIEALDSVAHRLEERSIELGWEVLEILLDFADDTEDRNE